jgi:hypothetical protein
MAHPKKAWGKAVARICSVLGTVNGNRGQFRQGRRR